MTQTTLTAANLKVTHDKATNPSKILEMIDEANSKNVDILVLPELALQGYIVFAFRWGKKESVEQKRNFMREAEPIPVQRQRQLRSGPARAE